MAITGSHVRNKSSGDTTSGNTNNITSTSFNNIKSGNKKVIVQTMVITISPLAIVAAHVDGETPEGKAITTTLTPL